MNYPLPNFLRPISVAGGVEGSGQDEGAVELLIIIVIIVESNKQTSSSLSKDLERLRD